MTMELVNDKVVRVPVQQGQQLLARKGSMLYYTGDVRFTPHSMGGGGGFPGAGAMAGMAGRMMQGEHVALMAASGQGEVFYGREGLRIELVQMDGSQVLTVEASRLLAYEGYLQTSIVPLTQQGGMRGAVRGAMTGQGMFTTQMTGQGTVAILSHGGVVPLTVGGYAGEVVIDPQAYVGHLGQITIELAASVGFRDVVGRGSGEATQLKLTGQGTAWVQASEQKF